MLWMEVSGPTEEQGLGAISVWQGQSLFYTAGSGVLSLCPGAQLLFCSALSDS